MAAGLTSLLGSGGAVCIWCTHSHLVTSSMVLSAFVGWMCLTCPLLLLGVGSCR